MSLFPAKPHCGEERRLRAGAKLKFDFGVVGWLPERAGKMENVVKTTMDEASGENPRAMFYKKSL